MSRHILLPENFRQTASLIVEKCKGVKNQASMLDTIEMLLSKQANFYNLDEYKSFCIGCSKELSLPVHEFKDFDSLSERLEELFYNGKAAKSFYLDYLFDLDNCLKSLAYHDEDYITLEGSEALACDIHAFRKSELIPDGVADSIPDMDGEYLVCFTQKGLDLNLGSWYSADDLKGCFDVIHQGIYLYLKKNNPEFFSKRKYGISPLKFSEIAQDIIEVSRERAKGKIRQELVTNVLRKRAGFQSMQTFDDYIRKQGTSESPYEKAEFVSDLYFELDQFNDVFDNPVASRYFDHYFGTKGSLDYVEVANDGIYEGFCMIGKADECMVYILSSNVIKERLFDAYRNLLPDGMYKAKYIVYVDTFRKEGIYSGTPEINKSYKLCYTDSPQRAIKHAVEMIRMSA
ncbi:hypothetical protein [Vibrio sp. D431a]|uniref:hypothetical protein n=1 Tax=Vibrio sp. D431a TaxID=2837388 RepID=UPI0025542025|nr:hypothetical protein [Vibrio sp. D431a]MDK9793744.1 hypothetical protein [Vibrio sp. D431a]